MSRWFDERYITLYAVIAGAFPVMSIFLHIGPLQKSFCAITVLIIASHWRSSRRLLRQIEALTDADKLPSNDATKLWTSAGLTLANGFMLAVLSWIVSTMIAMHLVHKH